MLKEKNDPKANSINFALPCKAKKLAFFLTDAFQGAYAGYSRLLHMNCSDQLAGSKWNWLGNENTYKGWLSKAANNDSCTMIFNIQDYDDIVVKLSRVDRLNSQLAIKSNCF